MTNKKKVVRPFSLDPEVADRLAEMPRNTRSATVNRLLRLGLGLDQDENAASIERRIEVEVRKQVEKELSRLRSGI